MIQTTPPNRDVPPHTHTSRSYFAPGFARLANSGARHHKKSKTCKACRCVHEWIGTLIWRGLFLQSCKERRYLATATWAHAHLWHLMDTHGRYLSDEVAKEIHHVGYTFLLSYAAVAIVAAQKGEAGCMITPKFHYCAHMLDYVLRYKLNPRFVHCFGAEDFVGRQANVAKACHRSTCAKRCAERFLVMLGHRWAKLLRPLP